MVSVHLNDFLEKSRGDDSEVLGVRKGGQLGGRWGPDDTEDKLSQVFRVSVFAG